MSWSHRSTSTTIASAAAAVPQRRAPSTASRPSLPSSSSLLLRPDFRVSLQRGTTNTSSLPPTQGSGGSRRQAAGSQPPAPRPPPRAGLGGRGAGAGRSPSLLSTRLTTTNNTSSTSSAAASAADRAQLRELQRFNAAIGRIQSGLDAQLGAHREELVQSGELLGRARRLTERLAVLRQKLEMCFETNMGMERTLRLNNSSNGAATSSYGRHHDDDFTGRRSGSGATTASSSGGGGPDASALQAVLRSSRIVLGGSHHHNGHGYDDDDDDSTGRRCGNAYDDYDDGDLDDDCPEEFLCPITQSLMIDPVFTADGNLYERAAIMEWFGGFSRRGLVPTSPLTNLLLPDARLTPNETLRLQIQQFVAQRARERRQQRQQQQEEKGLEVSGTAQKPPPPPPPPQEKSETPPHMEVPVPALGQQGGGEGGVNITDSGGDAGLYFLSPPTPPQTRAAPPRSESTASTGVGANGAVSEEAPAVAVPLTHSAATVDLGVLRAHHMTATNDHSGGVGYNTNSLDGTASSFTFLASSHASRLAQLQRERQREDTVAAAAAEAARSRRAPLVASNTRSHTSGDIRGPLPATGADPPDDDIHDLSATDSSPPSLASTNPIWSSAVVPLHEPNSRALNLLRVGGGGGGIEEDDDGDRHDGSVTGGINNNTGSLGRGDWRRIRGGGGVTGAGIGGGGGGAMDLMAPSSTTASTTAMTEAHLSRTAERLALARREASSSSSSVTTTARTSAVTTIAPTTIATMAPTTRSIGIVPTSTTSSTTTRSSSRPLIVLPHHHHSNAGSGADLNHRRTQRQRF